MTTQARELANLVSNAGDVSLGDDITLASDGAVINLGADSDVSLTHVHNAGILLNSTRKLQFGDAGTFIHQSADGVLDLVSDTEIEINATTIDINGNADISGTLGVTGAITGNLTGTASLATTSTITANNTASETVFPVFVDGATGTQGLETDTGFTYNPGTNTLAVVNLTVSGTNTIVDSVTMNANNGVIFEGASANDHETTLTSVDATADRTISLPDATGTLSLIAGTETLTNKTLTSPVISTIAGSTITLDSAGAITLNADGGVVDFKDGSANIGRFENASSDFKIESRVQDKDIVLVGNDGGTGIEALRLDMSAAGKATFTGEIEISAGSPTFILNANSQATNKKKIRLAASQVAAGDFHIQQMADNGTTILLNAFSIANGGNVGIGSSAPENLLHVKAGDNVTAVLKIEGGKPTVTAVGEINAQLDFGSNDASVNGTGNIGGRIASVTETTNGAYVGMAFSTFKQDADPKLNEHLRIRADGKIGIGDNAPQDRLEIRGVAGTRGGLTISNTNHNEPAISFARNVAATARIHITEPGALHTSSLVFQTSNASGGAPNLVDAMTINKDGNILPQFNVELKDSKIMLFGNSGDGRIAFDGTDTLNITATNGSATTLVAKANTVFLQSAANKVMFKGIANGASEIYFNDNKKLHTLNTGIQVTGNVTVSGNYGTSANDLDLVYPAGSGKELRIFRANGNTVAIFNEAEQLLLGGATTASDSATGVSVQHGSQTNKYGFRHDGAGKFMRMGCPNASFAYIETDASSGIRLDAAVSKASGSFRIKHPLPSKNSTHDLVHSFIEGPQADNIYRGVTTLVSGSATINIDTVSGMTEGTYVLLNTNTSCFTSNETDWDAVKGSVSGNTLTITCQNSSSTATVSWLVIGERHDQHMKDTGWTNADGTVIVEPLQDVR